LFELEIIKFTQKQLDIKNKILIVIVYRKRRKKARNYTKSGIQTETKSDMASLSSQTARAGHLSHRVSAAQPPSTDTKKEMTRTTLQYQIDSSADHINSTEGQEIERR